jgi:multidrug efflux pump subunit AcrB
MRCENVQEQLNRFAAGDLPAADRQVVDIADPVERLMATVDYLDDLESTCREGIYSLDVNFQYGADVDVAFQDVLAALNSVKLPALILGSAPFCLTGLVFGLYVSGLAFGATVLIGILVVIALDHQRRCAADDLRRGAAPCD